MGAKVVSVSADDVTYYVLPGSQGELTREGQVVDDSVFGQTFRSGFTGILSWGFQGNAVYKGYAGYQATVKKTGASTGLTGGGEATTLVSTRVYQITNTAKRVIDPATALTVKDGASDVTAQVQDIDFLNGIVTFKNSYTVVGAITVTGNYLPLASLCKLRGFTLTMQADAVNNTDNCTAQSNGGYMTSFAGMRTAKLEAQGIYDSTNAFVAALNARSTFVIEICPDGGGDSVARGFFMVTNDKMSGNVGALEEENISFDLQVPVPTSAVTLKAPLVWTHSNTTKIPTAIRKLLDGWSAQTDVYVKYLGDGTNGAKGPGVVTNMSMTNSMEGMNTFSVQIQGNGALVAQP